MSVGTAFLLSSATLPLPEVWLRTAGLRWQEACRVPGGDTPPGEFRRECGGRCCRLYARPPRDAMGAGSATAECRLVHGDATPDYGVTATYDFPRSRRPLTAWPHRRNLARRDIDASRCPYVGEGGCLVPQEEASRPLSRVGLRGPEGRTGIGGECRVIPENAGVMAFLGVLGIAAAAWVERLKHRSCRGTDRDGVVRPAGAACAACGGRCCTLYRGLPLVPVPWCLGTRKSILDVVHDRAGGRYGIEPPYDAALAFRPLAGIGYRRELRSLGTDTDWCQYAGPEGCLIPETSRPGICRTWACDRLLEERGEI